MVIENYLDEDGTITFYLKPVKELSSFLKPETIAELNSPDNDASAEFYASLDCRSLDWKFSCVFHDVKSVGMNDMEIEPPHNAKARLASGINDWCEKRLGGNILKIADRHLEHLGIPLSVKNCMERLRNLNFGETVCSARKLYTESYSFGNALAFEYNEFLPDALERTGEVIKENGLGRIFLEIAPMDAYAASVDEDERPDLYERIDEEQDNLQRISDSEMDEMREMDDDIQRYDAEFVLDPRLGNVVVNLRGRDSDEVACAWISIGEMRRVAAKKPEQNHAHVAKHGM